MEDYDRMKMSIDREKPRKDDRIASAVEAAVASGLGPALASLRVEAAAIARFIGYADSVIPSAMRYVFNDAISSARRNADPAAELRIHAGVRVLEDRVACGAISFETGAAIASGLRGAEWIAVFAATAGPGMDEAYKSAAGDGELMTGYAIDCAGSVLAEAIADTLDRILAAACDARGLGTTTRYSPGYCGWNVSEQAKLFSLLPPHCCGISLTGSHLMVPIKSVSGIIGIGKNTAKLQYGCATCDRKDCTITRRKRS
jgi:hypothetical protein